MLGIGFWEMLVIAALILIAVGPDRLPEMVKTVARFYRQFRRTAEELRASTGIDDLLRDEELRELAELRRQKLEMLAAKSAAQPMGPVPAGKPTAPVQAPAYPSTSTMASEPSVPRDDPGHAWVGGAIPRASGAPTKPAAEAGPLGTAELTAEVPEEGVDVHEARRFEREPTEDELRLRRARIAAKTTGRSVEEILAEEAARTSSAVVEAG